LSEDASSRIRDASVADQARDRIVRLVDFLKDFDAQKNPPVTDIDVYRLFSVTGEDLPQVPALDLTGGAERWLSIAFVDLPAAPAIPSDLKDYLPRSSQLSATLRPEPTIPADEFVRTYGDPDAEPEPSERGRERLATAVNWVESSWAPWSREWLIGQKTKEFYRRLFEQQQLIANDRETYELVWGFGRLAWSPGGVKINHPLFTVEVEITSDSNNSLYITPVRPLEFETLPYAKVDLADRAALGAIREAVAADPFDPWTADVLAAQARSVVRALHHEGVLVGEGALSAGIPKTDTGWVLYTRRRQPDRQGFLDAMRALYESGVQPPDALSSVVVDAPSAYEVDDGEFNDTFDVDPASSSGHSAEPLLLPLPSNEEQQRILRIAQRQSGVIVQGPPGTGKSHTIANLVSHYVAYGHRVLVVAEKEQALTVLGEKIPPQIRELAVSVLGSDESSRRALEHAISSIQGHVSNLDRRAEDRRIQDLSTDLGALDARIAETTNRMMRARRSETETLAGAWPVVPASPERAAAWISEHRDDAGYIPDPITPSTRTPLSGEELSELTRLLDEIGLPRARQSAYTLPDLQRLPREGKLVELIARRDQVRAALATAAPEIEEWAGIDGAPPPHLADLRTRLEAEANALEIASQPWLAAVSSQLSDPLLNQDWRRFLDEVTADRQRVLALRPQLSAHHVELPAHTGPAFVARLEQARARLAERGKLGMFSGEVKKAIESCRVDGATPSTAYAVSVCLLAVHLGWSRQQLHRRWLNQIGPFQGPDLPADRPEDLLGTLLAQLAEILLAPQRWTQLTRDLQTIGVTARGGHQANTVARLLEVIDIARARVHEREITTQLDDLARYLREGAAEQGASPLWELLADALTSEMVAAWAQHRDAVADLVDVAAPARRLIELGDRLHAVAPVWANQIYADTSAAGSPELLDTAWTWRQLDSWVTSVMAGDSPQQLQRALEELTVQRHQLVGELVGAQAWRRLADNLGDRQRQALNRYLAATKRFGKTGGKFAARWLSEIRSALNDSKDAVPVWVMTTARALASFRPDAHPPFDVIIIDEASQIGVEALPLLALANRAIVVGDDKQTSPGAVGVDQLAVFDLIDAHLSDVPGHRLMFNPGSSLYDLARHKFPSLVMLREHFRCLPEIISYSNTTFYADKIEPLREDRPAPGWQALGAVRVLDGYLSRATDTNEPEANVVADLVAKMIDDPTYDGMTFGVVSLRAGAQTQLIHSKLFDRLGPAAWDERSLRVGDAANFQGDERDVMFVCTVVGPDPADPGRRIGAMTSSDAEQRINVAASRARNQMIVVHSIEPEDFPNNDLRAGLIRHCRSPFEVGQDAADALAKCDSEFERMVLRRIIARGYARVRSQVRVGAESNSYRIDLVVDGPESRLAVECDGERWHGEDRWHADRARQEVLERAGWKFCRIRGSAFFRDPDAALEPLWARLDDLEIPTGTDWLDQSAGPRPSVLELRGSDLLSSEEASEPVGGASTEADSEHTSRPDISWAPPSDAEAPWYRDSSHQTEPDASGPPDVPVERTASHNEPIRSDEALGGIAAAVTLAPYRQFSGGPFAAVALESRAEIAAGLREIIDVEGPVLALRAYQLYVRASGGVRAGAEIKRILNKVTSDQIRAGRIRYIRDSAFKMEDRTLYLPGAQPVLMRELGPRVLHEVPMSEVQSLISALDLDVRDPSSSVDRAVLDAYGLSRPASKTSKFLAGCREYSFQVDQANQP